LLAGEFEHRTPEFITYMYIPFKEAIDRIWSTYNNIRICYKMNLFTFFSFNTNQAAYSRKSSYIEVCLSMGVFAVVLYW